MQLKMAYVCKFSIKQPISCNTSLDQDQTAPRREVRKKALNQESMKSSTTVPRLTGDTIWQSDKITRKLHIQESQDVSPFPAGGSKGCKEQTRQYNKDKRETLKTKNLECLDMFNSTSHP